MFEIAKAMAKEVEPRKIRKDGEAGFYAGYALTQPELTSLFYNEGFTRDSTIRKYQELWVKCGWAIRAMNGVIFFSLNPESDKAMIRELEEIRKSFMENGEMDISYVGLKGAVA
jgi:hypothetical protein